MKQNFLKTLQHDVYLLATEAEQSKFLKVLPERNSWSPTSPATNFMTFPWLSRTIRIFFQDLLGARQRLNMKTNSSDLLYIHSIIQCTKFIISKNWEKTIQLHLFTHGGAMLVLHIVYIEPQVNLSTIRDLIFQYFLGPYSQTMS